MEQPSSSVSGAQVGEAFKEWVERIRQQKGTVVLIDEFNAIKNEKLTGTTTGYDNNTPLNRYGNIPCLDETRVVLNDGLPNSYIHANYVDGYNRPRAYIICQAPVAASIIDYWRMVWQERITFIVMLTSLKERGNPKAEAFFPIELKRPFRAGPFRIFPESINPLPGHHRVVLAHLRLRCWVAKKSLNAERLVVMIIYGTWPDTAVPVDTPQFLKFVRLIKMFESWTGERSPPGKGQPPSLIHCSAGVGRSATLVACRIALDQMEATEQVDIMGVVRRMRKQRAMAVQNVLQYIFINLLVAEAGRQRRSG